jgi:hypothetical protein
MDLHALREWLIANGKTPEELDEFMELPVIRDIGDGLLLSLQNDDDIGNTLIMLMMRIDELEARVAQLEGGNANA